MKQLLLHDDDTVVRKYQQPIGVATWDFTPGEHVHAQLHRCDNVG